MSHKVIRIICALVCFIFAFQNLTYAAKSEESASTKKMEIFENVNISDSISYVDYLKNKNINLDNINKNENIIFDYTKLKDFDGDFSYENDSIIINEEGFIVLKFISDSDIFYNIEIEYFPVEGRSSDVEIMIFDDGYLPFREAANITLNRIWKDKTGIMEDPNGNDLRPSQIEFPRWSTKRLIDSSGYNVRPLIFKISQGKNEYTIYSRRESVRIRKITFKSPEDIISYSDYIQNHSEKVKSQKSVRIQAQNPVWKNDPTLVAITDRVSPLTYPNKGSKISRNMIGGENWSIPGQEITWVVDVPESGLYELRMRSRQRYARGFYSSRTLKINGEIPFSEAQTIRFTFGNWQIFTFGEDEPFLIFLDEGYNEISLQVTLGDFAEILGRAEETLIVLNDIYRQLLMIMGSTPDTLRDYNLDKQIPETLLEMGNQSEKIRQISEDIRQVTKFSGSELAILNKISLQLLEFQEKPYDIPKRLGFFKDNIAGFNTWIINAKNRPLDIDFLEIAAPGSEKPPVEASLFRRIVYFFQLFIASFFEDYNAFTSEGIMAENTITVWSTTGRDQAQIMNDLIRSDFTPVVGLGVNLQLVQPDAILPSTAAGNGPDVLLNAGMQLPVNYATRRAVVDLGRFEDLDDVLGRFRESAVTPFRFEGGVYALPERQTFNMMFYRTDILNEIGIVPPQTWDDVIHILPNLQQKNMSFLMDTGTSAGSDVSVGMHTFAMFLFQNGGQFYHADGISTDLDSNTAVEAFRFWTRFYTNYGLPTNFNIANRFRTGESPIVIADLLLYSQLIVSAPEIRGLWEMTPVPGTMKQDGTIDRSISSSVAACMLISIDESKMDFSWEFMKWWTGKDTQVSFAREMESLLGTSARYPTANVEALEQLPWSLRDLRKIQEQSQWLVGIPEVPGGYFTPRHINNAFRSVVIGSVGFGGGDEPRETILEFAKIINDEIFDKRTEFGLPVIR